MNDELVFRVKSYPSFGLKGYICDKSLTVYNDGRVTNSIYVYDNLDTPVEEKVIGRVSGEIVNEVLHYYDLRQWSIGCIPSHLSGSIIDGPIYEFIFGDKRVVAVGIKRYDPEEVKKNNFLYYFDHQDSIKYINLLLDIYGEVKGILTKHGLDVEFPIKS